MDIEKASKCLKTLGHPQRLMIMSHLSQGEKNVGELFELCNISQSQLSQFLNRMHKEKILKVRKEGQFSYYSIGDNKIEKLLQLLEKTFN